MSAGRADGTYRLPGTEPTKFVPLDEEFERRLPDLVAAGKLDPEVLLNVSAAVPRAPVIRRSPGKLPQVHVQVAYLELLWAFIYSWMVICEETV